MQVRPRSPVVLALALLACTSARHRGTAPSQDPGLGIQSAGPTQTDAAKSVDSAAAVSGSDSATPRVADPPPADTARDARALPEDAQPPATMESTADAGADAAVGVDAASSSPDPTRCTGASCAACPIPGVGGPPRGTRCADGQICVIRNQFNREVYCLPDPCGSAPLTCACAASACGDYQCDMTWPGGVRCK